jgi:hypothetical protein
LRSAALALLVSGCASTTLPVVVAAPPQAPPRIEPAETASAAFVLRGIPVVDGARVPMPGLELACLPSEDALVDPKKAHAKLDATALEQGVVLGGPRIVRITRDPRRSLHDPAPRACRPVEETTRLAAPLYREREAPSLWVLVLPRGSVVEDTAHVLREAGKQAVLAVPRVLLDERGDTLAFAVPVAPE